MSIATYHNPLTNEDFIATVAEGTNTSAIEAAMAFVDRNDGVWIWGTGYAAKSLLPVIDGRKNLKHFQQELKLLDPPPDGLAAMQKGLIQVSQLRWDKIESYAPASDDEDISIFSSIPRWAQLVLRKYMGFAVLDDDGTHTLITRVADPDLTFEQNMERHVWIHTTNPLIALDNSEFFYEDETGKTRRSSLLVRLDLELIQARTEANSTWGVVKVGDHTRALLMTQLWGKCKLEQLIPLTRRMKRHLLDFTNDPQVSALQYFPLNALPPADLTQCQDWLNFESQMPEWGIPAWRATVFGIYDAGNRSKQIMILRDGGSTGKSPIFNTLAKMGGRRFACSLTQQSVDSQFWGSTVFGRRLALIPDTNNSRWLMTSKIKQLSGGDTVNVEFKGQTPFCWKPNIRFIISCNCILEIDLSQKNQLDRVLYIPLTAGNWAYDPTYESRLEAQFWCYLSVCAESYERVCVNHGNIIQPPQMLQELSEVCTFAPAQDIDSLGLFIQPDPRGEISDRCIMALLDYAAIKQRDSRKQMETIREGMKMRWGVRELGTRAEGLLKPDRFYRGIRLRDGLCYSDKDGKIKTQTKRLAKPEEDEL